MKVARLAAISLFLIASSLGQVKVKGYDRKDGTHVEGYSRGKPNHPDHSANTNLYNPSPRGRVLSVYGHCAVVDPGFIVCGDHLLGPQEKIPQAAQAMAPRRDSRGRIKRSKEVLTTFQYYDPCPANGHARGRCPGYVIDHIVPLACGGVDDPVNLQWQTVAEGKAKDKWERKGCSK